MEIVEKKSWTRSIKDFILNNKIISITILVFCLCLILNFSLIFYFMKILENM